VEATGVFDVASPILSVAGAVGLTTVTTITTAVVTAIITRYKSNRTTVEQFEYFPPSDNEEINTKVYNALVDKIDAARNTILITGAGFESSEYSRPKGRRIARNYLHALKDALRRDVKIVRIQTRGPISKEWAYAMKELIMEFPDSFGLYYLPITNREMSIISFAVIDPDLPKVCAVELLISSKMIRGTAPLHVAGTAIFITGNQKLSEAMVQTFTPMREAADAVYVQNASMLDQYSET
jgi:hypothetical protein